MRARRRGSRAAALSVAAILASLGAAERIASAQGVRFVSPTPPSPPPAPPPVTSTPGGVPPPTTRPSGAGPVTPTPAPSTPATPPPVTGGTGSAPGGTSTPIGPRGRAAIASGWRLWWEANADAIRARHEGRRTDTGTVFRDADASSTNVGDAARRTRVAVEREILPTLRWAIADGPRDADCLASAALALGKTTNDPADLAVLVDLLQTKTASPMAREGAAMALGLLRRTNEAERFDGRAIDGLRETLFAVVDDGKAGTRLRGFAALAIGLLGDQPSDPSDAFAKDGRLAVRGIWTRLAKRWSSEDVPVALVVALSLQPREGVPGAVLDGLRDACLKGRIGREPVGPLTRAQAALALARLGEGESTGLFLGIARAHRHDLVLRRSCVTALGILAPSLDPAMRTVAATGLADVLKFGEPEVSGLALVSIARLLEADFASGSSAVADAGAGEMLFRQLERGNAANRPFAALALSLAARAEGRATQLPSFTSLHDRAAHALREAIADEGESPDVRGALAIALGLTEDPAGALPLVQIAGRRGGNPALRADACDALGLLGAPTPEVLAALRASVDVKGLDDVRRAAARSLGMLGDVTAVPLLLREITSGTSDHLLARAAIALGEIRDPAAVSPLVTIARNRATADTSRAVVLAALGLVGDLEPRPSLCRLAADSNYLARTDAILEALSLL
jgi:HEAT repeat protein